LKSDWARLPDSAVLEILEIFLCFIVDIF